VNEYRKTLAKHSKLAETFDFAEATSEARARLKNVEEELSMAKDVWDTVALCEQQFDVWKATLWVDINTELMEDASKAFVKEVSLSPCCSKDSFSDRPFSELSRTWEGCCAVRSVHCTCIAGSINQQDDP
jgi:hypothetical protein